MAGRQSSPWGPAQTHPPLTDDASKLMMRKTDRRTRANITSPYGMGAANAPEALPREMVYVPYMGFKSRRTCWTNTPILAMPVMGTTTTSPLLQGHVVLEILAFQGRGQIGLHPLRLLEGPAPDDDHPGHISLIRLTPGRGNGLEDGQVAFPGNGLGRRPPGRPQRPTGRRS